MSQLSKSQSQIFFLKDLVKYFEKNKTIETISFDLSEDDLEFLSVDNYGEPIDDDLKIIEQIAKFCSNYLTKCTFEQLCNENFFQAIGYQLYSSSSSLFVHTSSDFEAKMASLLASVDSIYDYLAKTTGLVQIKFESIDLFMLSTFHLYVHLCNHFKTQKEPSQRISLSQQTHRPEAKLSAQLIKASSLFESKISNLNEENNKKNLFKLTKYLIYLIKNFKDAKSNVFVWKMISRLCVKFKILLTDYTNAECFIEKNGKFLLKKIFILIYDDQNLNLNYIKDSLSRLSLNESNRVSDMSSVMGSQMTLKNNIYLDTAKVIKLSAFLAKILKSFLGLYFDDLFNFLQNEYFDMLTILLSSINSILLTESRINSECLTKDLNQFDFKPNQLINLPKDYVSIKLDFIKEFCPIYESLLQLVESNYDYAYYMNTSNYFMKKIEDFKKEEDVLSPTQSHSVDQDHTDEILLFYLTFVNRSKAKLNYQEEFKSSFDLINSPVYLNQIFNLAELSSINLSLPTYFLYNDQFFSNLDFNYLSVSNYETKAFTRIEFYDILLICMSRYILRILKSNTEQVIFFLLNNLLIANNLIDENIQNQKNVYQFYALRIQLSSDLLVCLAKCLIKSNQNENLLKLVKFLSEAYESNGSYTIFQHNCNLKFVLNQMLEMCSQINSSHLKDFYIKKRFFNCFSLILPHLKKHPDAKKEIFIVNILTKTSELFESLIKLFVEKTKMSSDQLWMRKCIVFLDTNHFGEILGLVDDFFDQTMNELTTLVHEQAQKVFKLISQFLKLNEIANLGKYFDHFSQYKTEMSRKMESNQLFSKQFSQNMENFKRIFQLICVCARIFANLCLKCNFKSSFNENIIFLLEFFIKNCSENNENKINSGAEPAFLNIKLEASLFLRNLSKKEINESKIVEKILQLFEILLNDSSPVVKFFSLECLDEYSKANESNNKIICQLSRSNKNLNDLILNHLVEISIDKNFDEMNFYIEKRSQLLKRLKVHHHQPKEEDLLSQKIDECGGLDETMNAIMCAMDTTISNQETKLNDSDDDLNCTESKAQEVLHTISGEIDKLLSIYNHQSMPESIKTQLNNLVSKISSFV